MTVVLKAVSGLSRGGSATLLALGTTKVSWARMTMLVSGSRSLLSTITALLIASLEGAGEEDIGGNSVKMDASGRLTVGGSADYDKRRSPRGIEVMVGMIGTTTMLGLLSWADAECKVMRARAPKGCSKVAS